MKTTLQALSFGGIGTIAGIAGGTDLGRIDYIPGIIISIGILLMVLCLCYLLHRMDKPLYYNGRAFYRMDYYLACGFTESDILKALSYGVSAKQSIRNYLYICDAEFTQYITNRKPPIEAATSNRRQSKRFN